MQKLRGRKSKNECHLSGRLKEIGKSIKIKIESEKKTGKERTKESVKESASSTFIDYSGE